MHDFVLDELLVLIRTDFFGHEMRSSALLRWVFNLQNRTGCVLASSKRRRHPWRWRFSFLRVPYKLRRHGLRFPRTPSKRHEFPRISIQKYVSRRPCAPNAWLPVLWCPGCCRAALCDDASRHLSPILYLLFLCRSSFLICTRNVNITNAGKRI